MSGSSTFIHGSKLAYDGEHFRDGSEYGSLINSVMLPRATWQ